MARVLLTSLLALLLLLPVAVETDDGGGGGARDANTDTKGGADSAVSEDAGVDAPVDVDDQGDTDSPEDSYAADGGGETALPVVCAFHGVILDAAGAPVEGVPVVICSEDSPNCASDKSQADGVFEVSNLEPIVYGAKFLGGGVGLSSVTLPLAPCQATRVDIGEVRMVALPEGQVITAADGGEVQAHEDLKLLLPAGLTFPNYDDAIAVRAARLDAAMIHPMLGMHEPPRAAFALDPYGTKAPEAVGFVVDLGKADVEVKARALDHLSGQWITLGTGTTDAEGVFTSEAGAGPHELTWLVFE